MTRNVMVELLREPGTTGLTTPRHADDLQRRGLARIVSGSTDTPQTITSAPPSLAIAGAWRKADRALTEMPEDAAYALPGERLTNAEKSKRLAARLNWCERWAITPGDLREAWKRQRARTQGGRGGHGTTAQ